MELDRPNANVGKRSRDARILDGDAGAAFRRMSEALPSEAVLS